MSLFAIQHMTWHCYPQHHHCLAIVTHNTVSYSAFSTLTPRVIWRCYSALLPSAPRTIRLSIKTPSKTRALSPTTPYIARHCHTEHRIQIAITLNLHRHCQRRLNGLLWMVTHNEAYDSACHPQHRIRLSIVTLCTSHDPALSPRTPPLTRPLYTVELVIVIHKTNNICRCRPPTYHSK
jgi:hypothetical protein